MSTIRSAYTTVCHWNVPGPQKVRCIFFIFEKKFTQAFCFEQSCPQKTFSLSLPPLQKASRKFKVSEEWLQSCDARWHLGAVKFPRHFAKSLINLTHQMRFSPSFRWYFFIRDMICTGFGSLWGASRTFRLLEISSLRLFRITRGPLSHAITLLVHLLKTVALYLCMVLHFSFSPITIHFPHSTNTGCVPSA